MNKPSSMDAAVTAVRRLTDRAPRLALVLGSGLGALADDASDAFRIECSDIPGYPLPAVEGHRGRLVFARMQGIEVFFIQGRVHRYEGHDLDSVTFPIRLAAALGATHALITNAAGGINPAFPPSTLMWIDGVMDWTQPRPWTSPSSRIDRSTHDSDWLEEADAAVSRIGVTVQRGVYIYVLGPSYETKAEIRAFRTLGADAVGMSTVPEMHAAHEAGMHVLGLSTITNAAAGMSDGLLGHGEVVETGRRVRGTLERLVGAVAGTLSA